MLNLLAQAAAADPNASSGEASTNAEQIMTYLSQNLADLCLNLLAALAIFLIGRWIARLVAGFISRAMEKSKVDPVLIRFVNNLVYIGLLVLVIIGVLDKLGVETTSFAAILAAAGLAIGLALQGSLSNFAAGVLMVIFRPVRVGDFVEVGGAAGTVEEVQIFNTVLNSPDNIRIIVPNAQVTGSNIKNYSANGTRRVDMVIGVGYDDDLKKARQIIESVLSQESRLLDDPAPTVAVSELADSSVNFVVRPWVKTADYWDVYFNLTEGIKNALDEGGINIPYPQQDIHIKTPVTVGK